MRILIATWTRERVGGAETHLARVVPRILARGHQVGWLHETEGEGPTFLDATLMESNISVARQGRDRAVSLARAFAPDITYCNGLLDPALEQALQSIGASVLSAHGYYGTCVSGTKSLAFPSATPCERTLGPACLALYLPRRCGGRHPLRMVAEYGLASRRRSLLAGYDVVIVHSAHMQREYARHGIDAKLVSLPVGTEGPAVAPAARPHRLIYVGRMARLKGGPELITARALASRLLRRDLELDFVGDGPDRALWERAARGNEQRVRFRGWLSPEEVREALSKAHLVAVPSMFPEPFGLVGLEAAALGLPAVGFAMGGIPEWLLDGTTGALAELPASALSLARAIVRCLDDDEVYARLCRGALEHQRRFSAETATDQLLSVFEGLSVRRARGKGNAS